MTVGSGAGVARRSQKKDQGVVDVIVYHCRTSAYSSQLVLSTHGSYSVAAGETV